MTSTEKNAAILYELSEEIDFLIKAGKLMAQKSPNTCCVGACCILQGIRDEIQGVAERIEAA